MKQLLISIVLFFFYLGLSATNVFTVFRVTGEVQRKSISASEWVSVHRRDTVKLSDRVNIPTGGEIRILESGSGLIHTLSEKGEFSVKEIIDRSKAATKGLIGAVSSELFNEAKSKVSSAGTNYNTHGATYRGNESEEDVALQALHDRILKGEEDISLSLVPVGETFRFQIKNSSGVSCIISILGICPSQATFCLPAEGIVVREGITLLEVPEVLPSEDVRYKAFRITDPFDGDALMRLFRQNAN